MNTYDAPGIGPDQFLYEVMCDPNVDLPIRVQAAKDLGYLLQLRRPVLPRPSYRNAFRNMTSSLRSTRPSLCCHVRPICELRSAYQCSRSASILWVSVTMPRSANSGACTKPD